MLQITTFGHMDFANASSQAVTFQCVPNPRMEVLSLFHPSWYSDSDLSPPAQAGDIKKPCPLTPMRAGAPSLRLWSLRKTSSDLTGILILGYCGSFWDRQWD